MSFPRKPRGAALLLAVLLAAVLAASFGAAALASRMALARERATESALAQAREALIAYAADRPINASVGPGYLPCPDLDGDGWAQSTCGSLDGASGQASRLGLLPWKTLGLPDLRDGAGERLWYAVSTRYKGLLNCAASSACVDMTPPRALGTITVRASDGSVTYDGTAASAAVAVVIAPGPPIERMERDGIHLQARRCAPGDCDAAGVCVTLPAQLAAPCDPRNFLDRAPGTAFADEDNADFVDRSDAAARARNTNGFIAGPVVLPGGRVAVNDRIAVVAYGDIVPRVMARVALEAAQCLRFYASRPGNAGRYPPPEAACAFGPRFGHLPDTPFGVGSSGMLERWWRSEARTPESLAELPTHDDACRIAVAPDDPGPVRTWPPSIPAGEGLTAPAPSWWLAWKPYVYVTIAAGRTPADAPGADCRASGGCITLVDTEGRTLREAQSAAILVAAACPDETLCANGDCTALVAERDARALHAIASLP
jgi:type II secretory pathway pseudopilin PulG